MGPGESRVPIRPLHLEDSHVPHTFPLACEGTSTRKQLSQNFLVDARAAQAVVRAARVRAGDTVLEIGAGDGMLTRQLLDHGYRVIAYEKDRYYARRLHARYAGDPRIRVIHNDFRRASAPDRPFAVVANIPFGISTDILRWCLDAERLTSATLLTQREFARKHPAITAGGANSPSLTGPRRR